MPGSMKGEKRGAAGARARRRTVPHETPEEVIKDVAKKKRAKARVVEKVVERRYLVARIIHGETGLAADMRPKDIMLEIAQNTYQAALDWRAIMMQNAAIIPPTKQSTKMCFYAQEQMERYEAMAIDYSYRAGSFHDPKLMAMKTFGGGALSNQASIVRDLLDVIDDRARNARLINPPVKKVG